MTLSISDRREILTEAEDITGWTNVGYGTQSTDVAEETFAVAESINIGNQSMYYTLGTPIDLSDTLIYVYSFNNALQNNWDNTIPPQALLIGDGTNRNGFHMAGTNKRVFNHLDGPTTWQCLVLDGSQASKMNAAGLSYADAGSFASLNLSSIVDIGCYFETLSKALGGGYNVSTDIIRYGNDGIYIVGGTGSDYGTFSELASADRSRADKTAHGIFRAYTTIAFGCQGPLTFGSTSPSASYFQDSGVVVVFENRNIGEDKYYLNIAGNSGVTNEFKLSNSTITTAAQSVTVSASNNIDVLDLNTVSFVGLKRDIYFPDDSDTQTHSVAGGTFTGCGTVYSGTVPFRNITFSNVSTSATASAAFYWETGADIRDCDFNNNTYSGLGSAGAITIPVSGTYTFDNLQFTGNDYDILYTGSAGTTATIQATNGSNVSTYYATNGGYVDIQNSVTITFTNVVSGSEIRILEAGTTNELDGIEEVPATGEWEYTYNYVAGTYIDYVVHHVEYTYIRVEDFLLPSVSQDIRIEQEYDRWYSNP